MTERRGQTLANVDPHWSWAEQTAFAGYLLKGDEKVRAVVELDEATETNERQRGEFLAASESPGGIVELPAIHKSRLQDGHCTHFVARLSLSAIASGAFSFNTRRIKPVFVGAGETRRSNDRPASPLPTNDLDMLAQIELGNLDLVRSRIAAQLAAAPLLWLHVTAKGGPATSAPPQVMHQFLSGALTLSVDAMPAPGGEAKVPARGVVVGVIDFGCPFAHAHFAADAIDGTPSTRVQYLWDQGRLAKWRDPQSGTDAANALWTCPAEFDYGREATASGLSDLMRAWLGQDLPIGRLALNRHDAVFEQICYASAGLPELLQNTSHGAHVLDIAAGRGFTPCEGAPLDDDAAALAPIVFVQLPELAVDDLSGGWLDAYIIDAMHYILDRARRIDATARVVVNVSFGSYAGPHDATSVIERALDDIAEIENAVVVLAAGNVPPPTRPIHAHGSLEGGQTGEVGWHIASDDATQSFLEVWASTAMGPTRSLRVELTSPLGRMLSIDAPGFVARTPAAGWKGDTCTEMVALQAVAGDRSLMALVAVGPTRRADQDEQHVEPSPSGRWTVRVTNQGSEPIDVHVWTERDEPSRNARDGRGQPWLECPPADPFETSFSHTLTAQSCGLRTVVVGGAVAVEGAIGELYPPTASGPTRTGARSGPDFAAPAARLSRDSIGSPQQLRGLHVGGNLSAGAFEAQGTSMAAPWVTRHVARLLVDGTQPNREAIRAAFFASSSSRDPMPPDDARCGLGVLRPDGTFVAGPVG